MNRRQFLPLFGLPAAIPLLPKSKLGAEIGRMAPCEYVLGWQEIAEPNGAAYSLSIPELNQALAEIEKLGAKVILIEDREFYHYIQAELVCSDFCAADRLKRSWIPPEGNRPITNAAITRSPNYQLPKDCWVVRWDEESGFSWHDNWPERRYDVTFQKSISNRAHIVQVREACNALTVWAFEEYYDDYIDAQDRYLSFERSGRYCRESLSLCRT